MMTSIFRNTATASTFLPVTLGVVGFMLFVGTDVLLPSNIAWLSENDAPQHFLGWQFFRTSDWGFPLGTNPRYGLELGSSIVYSDSLPLLAIPFKLLGPLLPEVFQYFGIWLLACFLAQAAFAWALLGLATRNVASRLLGAAFFVASPPMLNRVTAYPADTAHPTLVAQFLIVASLYAFLRPGDRRRVMIWFALMAVALLVHAYLFVMVAMFWLADLVRNVRRLTLSTSAALIEFAATVAITALLAWQVGYFSLGFNISAGGYGFYTTNLLTLIDPSGWSYLIPDIPETGGNYEGFAYLGLGVVGLAVLALWQLVACNFLLGVRLRREPELIIALIGLTIFAISTPIAIGPWTVGFPIPSVLVGFADVFRASGRMVWPIFYAILFVILFVILKSLPPRRAVPLLALALLVQLADTSAAWLGSRQVLAHTPEASWDTPLKSPFWKQASKQYKSVRHIATRNRALGWQHVASFAAWNGKATDMVYVARTNDQATAELQARGTAALATGLYDPETLYILDPELVSTAAATLRPDDLLARVDGFAVLAPGWRSCADCAAEVNPHITTQSQ